MMPILLVSEVKRKTWTTATHLHYDAHPLGVGGEGEDLEDGVAQQLLSDGAAQGHGVQVAMYQRQPHNLRPLHQRHLHHNILCCSFCTPQKYLLGATNISCW
jgi:hypothetical protein